MAALIALMAVCLFAVGVAAGIIGMVAVAIHREERNLTPTSAAPSQVVRAGRWLNGLYVRAPHRAATGDRKKIPIQSAYQAELAHAEPVSWTALPVRRRRGGTDSALSAHIRVSVPKRAKVCPLPLLIIY